MSLTETVDFSPIIVNLGLIEAITGFQNNPELIIFVVYCNTFRVMVMLSSVLSVRLSNAERSLLEVAAGHARLKLGDFIRRKALEAAEAELLERNLIVIPINRWEEIEALINAPARVIPAMKELARYAPAWKP